MEGIAVVGPISGSAGDVGPEIDGVIAVRNDSDVEISASCGRENKKIEPYFNLYYGPIGILYARIYIEYFSFDKNFLNDTIKKLDGFNKTYFLYSCIYILIIKILINR